MKITHFFRLRGKGFRNPSHGGVVGDTLLSANEIFCPSRGDGYPAGPLTFGKKKVIWGDQKLLKKSVEGQEMPLSANEIFRPLRGDEMEGVRP